MRRNLFWFFVLGLQQSSRQVRKVFAAEESAVGSIADCVSLAFDVSGGKSKAAVWHSAGREDLLSEILRKMKVPVVVNAVERAEPGARETRLPNELVILFGAVDVDRVLRETSWNGQTRFFILGDRLERVQIHFEQFWKFKVVNVFEILKNGKDLVVYSFFPYEKGSCGIGKPRVVDKYLTNTGNFVNGGVAFRDSSRIKNLNGCRINVTIVDVKPNVIFADECGCNGSTHIRGIEGTLLTEVAKKLNFEAMFLIALDGIGWGWIHPSPSGAVGEVYTGRSDFAIGLLAPTVERYENLDLSLPYDGDECITYGVPAGAGASTPYWITILVFEFGSLTWILIFVTFAWMFYVFRFMNELAGAKRFANKTDTILYVFSSCLGLPVKVPDRVSLKLSLACWIIFAFVVTVAYKSSMGSKLTVPTKDPDINYFEELLDSKLELTGYNNMFRLIEYGDPEPIFKKMRNRFKVTDFDIGYAVDRIAKERKIAYLRHTSTFLYYALSDPKASGQVHLIKDCLYSYRPVVVTKKHSPFSHALNQLISRLSESGITKRWRSEYIYDVPQPPKPFLKLSINHMYGVFCILCFGYLIGLLAFIIENVGFYFSK